MRRHRREGTADQHLLRAELLDHGLDFAADADHEEIRLGWNHAVAVGFEVGRRFLAQIHRLLFHVGLRSRVLERGDAAPFHQRVDAAHAVRTHLLDVLG